MSAARASLARELKPQKQNKNQGVSSVYGGVFFRGFFQKKYDGKKSRNLKPIPLPAITSYG